MFIWQEITSKRVLVTGGAGFLGRHLCQKLLEQQHTVIVLDNLNTGSIENIKEFLGNKNFHFIQHDVIEPIDIKIDWIFNFACPASPPKYQLDSIQTIKTCFVGALNMLELAKKYNAKIMQASTSEIYGDPSEHPQKESYWGNVNPVGLRSCYDEGKRCAETLFFEFYRKYNLDIKVIRIFNTYGPFMDPEDGRVVSNFIVQAIQNKKITVYGDGTQTRSFCFVDDLIEGILKVMSLPKSETGPFNLGNPEEFNLLELRDIIIKLTKTKSQTICVSLPSDDPLKRKPDITKVNKLTNWYPKISLIEGLQKTIEYFKKTKLRS